MNFVNNWSQALALASGATSCALDLPNGAYRLTLTDSASQASVWEIVDAVVENKAASLTRAREGTVARAWPAGSIIYCAVTAGVMSALSQQNEYLASVVADLQARVDTLEGGSIVLTSANQDDYRYGYWRDELGSLNPPFASTIKGANPVDGASGELIIMTWENRQLINRIRGQYSVETLPFKSISIDGKVFSASSDTASVYVNGSDTNINFSGVNVNPLADGTHKIKFGY